MLFDVPVHSGYKVLTNSSKLRYAKNGYGQVGNELFPKHPLAPQAIKKSSIYNKNISGISEAGYGRRYPYYGLSKYPGAGSPRGSFLADYPGAGSPRNSVLGAYAGAGSPRNSVLRDYAGAGSPKNSVLRDAYINDNPPPGTLRGIGRVGIEGRPSSRGWLKGLADDPTVTPSDASNWQWDPSIPEASPTPVAGSGILDTLSNAFGSLFKTSVAAATSSGQTAITRDIQGAVTPPPPTPTQKITTTLTKPTTLFGLSTGTLLLGGLAAAYFMTRKHA